MPEFNLADLFEVVAGAVPDRTALVAGGIRLTYRELDERANRFAGYLLGLGLPTGAHVGILAHNRAEWLEAMIGSFKARTVPINVNYRFVAPELAYLVDNADLEALVVEAPLVQLVEAAFAHTARRPRLVVMDEVGPTTEPKPEPEPEPDPDPDLDRHQRAPGPRALRTVSHTWEDALAAGAENPAPRGLSRSPDDRYVLYTGGTTGLPKGVVWRQEDVFFGAMGGGGWGATPISRPEELVERISVEPTVDRASGAVMVVTAPLMHGNAQWASWSAFFMGGTVVLYTEPSYDARAVLRLIEQERAVSVALVGDAMARPLAETVAAAPPGTYDTGSLVAIGSGGAMLSPAVKDDLRRTFPGVLVMDRFGASESGAQGAVGADATGPRFVMGADTTVLDDELRPLSPGDGRIGRLARRGRIPLCYHKDPARTAVTFPVDAGGTRWSVPGDLASIEADGTITVLGRGSASINTGGEKVFPEEVEAAIKSHPDVSDAIVVGVPDERFGERVAAVVRLRTPRTSLDLDDLRAHCRQLVAGYKLPRQLLVVDVLPLTGAGKPDAKAARARLEDRSARATTAHSG